MQLRTNLMLSSENLWGKWIVCVKHAELNTENPLKRNGFES